MSLKIIAYTGYLAFVQSKQYLMYQFIGIGHAMFSFLVKIVLMLAMSSTVLAAETVAERKRAAGHPATSVEQMQELSKDPDWTVRQYLGRNRRTPPDLLDKLAEDPHIQVRIAVATNLATTEATFMKLAKDKELAVRSVVARFEYVPENTLAFLADDSNADIRLEVAKNLNTTRDTLLKLKSDPQPEVAAAAEIGLQRLADEAGSQ